MKVFLFGLSRAAGAETAVATRGVERPVEAGARDPVVVATEAPAAGEDTRAALEEAGAVRPLTTRPTEAAVGALPPDTKELTPVMIFYSLLLPKGFETFYPSSCNICSIATLSFELLYTHTLC